MLSTITYARKYASKAYDAANNAWAKASVASLLAVAAAQASAQEAGADYGAVAKITSTQTTVLAIIAGFITMGIAVWGAMYVLRRFFPKGR